MAIIKATIRDRKSGEVYEWSTQIHHKPTPPEEKVYGRKILREFLNANGIKYAGGYDVEEMRFAKG